MWFKNLQIYRFTRPFQLSTPELEEHLEEGLFQPCSSQERSRYGWVAPLGEQGQQLVHSANGYLLLCAQQQEKILPASVVNEQLKQQVELLEDKESRRLSSKERQKLKDEVIFTLLPRAFVRNSRQYAYIAPREGLLVVDTASSQKAEDLLSHLRESLGSLPVVPVVANNIPQHAMTAWLKDDQAPSRFEIGGECELKDCSDDSSVIRAKNQELSSPEFKNLLESMYVAKLELSWQGGIDCLIDDKLAIKRLKYTDLIQDQVNEVAAEDAAQQFDVDFTIMTAELSRFFKDLLSAFGGEDLSALDDVE